MTNEETIRRLEDLQRLYLGNEKFTADIEAIEIAIEALKRTSWVPIIYRDMAEEEKEYFEAEFDEAKILDCTLPDIDEEVFVSHRGSVYTDIFHNDRGIVYFEDVDIEDVDAWMPLPKPYEKEGENNAKVN